MNRSTRWITIPTLMAWKRLLSYRKQDWELKDYPVRVEENRIHPELPERFVQHRYWADVLGWSLCEGGSSREEALTALAERFSERKARMTAEGEPLPRPGTQAPLQFVTQERISVHEALVDDLLSKVMGIEGAWVSDESSLWDFHEEATNDRFFVQIREIYGIDVSDIKSANLADIAERIATSKPAL